MRKNIFLGILITVNNGHLGTFLYSRNIDTPQYIHSKLGHRNIYNFFAIRSDGKGKKNMLK